VSAQRKALIVANDEYENEGLKHLLSPAADAKALGNVLRDPDIGDFDVQVASNQPSYVIQAQIEDFLSESHPEDVLLLHFSCHGLKSESGELFFAARNTRPNRLGSTAISADFVQRCMRASRSRSIVLLLDCCYGGAFSQGVRVRAGENINVLDAFPGGRLGGGRGRAVITASSAMEYAFEGDHLAEDSLPRPSVFTKALVDGLSTGDADRDEDGWISLNELYEYVFDKVREQNPHQTPSRDVEMQGEMYVARSRRQRIQAAPLPPGLDAATKDQNMYTRRGAVNELRSRLLSDNLPAAAGAWKALTVLANDIKYVADEARAALHEAAVRPTETELNFGRLVQGSPPPHRRVNLLGPPIARACKTEVTQPWIHVQPTSEGFDVSVDTAQAGPLTGRLNIKGPTGEATVIVEVTLLPSPPLPSPLKTASHEVPPATLTPSRLAETQPAASAAQPEQALITPSPLAPRPIATGPAHAVSRSGLSLLKKILSVLWSLLPTVSIGILTPILAPIPFAHAAVRLRERKLWLFASGYGLGSLTLWIIWIIAIEKKWTAASLVSYFILLAIGIGATIHAFQLRRRVFAPRPTRAHPDPPYVNTLEESTSPDDVLQAAIKRLESSGTSPNILEAVNGLRAMGYTLKLAETNVPGKRPENYLRIMDPKYTAHGIGYLTPKNFSFSRMSDRDRLAELPGATLVSSAVNFSHMKSAQPGLDAARLLKA
jgi:hypothetical protein